MRIELDGGRAIEVLRGDITVDTHADAIVNAANGALLPGGGVCGAIHRAGGPSIAWECREIIARRGELDAGDAVATTAGELPAKAVIHAVGPIWNGGESGEAANLRRCYLNAIEESDALGLASIAFPSISTGIYGYPLDLAAPIALAATRDALADAATVHLARFILFDDRTLAAYESAARAL